MKALTASSKTRGGSMRDWNDSELFLNKNLTALTTSRWNFFFGFPPSQNLKNLKITETSWVFSATRNTTMPQTNIVYSDKYNDEIYEYR